MQLCLRTCRTRAGVGAVPGVKATVHKAEAQREKAIASLRKAARVSRGGGADDTQVCVVRVCDISLQLVRYSKQPPLC